MRKQRSELRREVVETWEQIWRDHQSEIPEPSPVAIEIMNDIIRWTHDLQGKSILEAGSGTGVISALLANRGFYVTLLDISEDAIRISKSVFAKNGVKGNFVHGDLFTMPSPDNTFDLVWNAGVLEHFKENGRITALREMARVIKPGGLVLTYNPYSKAVFYRTGKWWAERTGKWEFGSEFPVRSLVLASQGKEAGLKMIEEYPICAKEQLRFLSKYIVKGSARIVRYTTAWMPKRLWICLFGGYLLCSVFKKLS